MKTTATVTDLDQTQKTDVEAYKLYVEARTFIAERVQETKGPMVSFYAGELADLLGVSPMDILLWTKDNAYRWWIEGHKFFDFADMQTVGRYLGYEYVEIDIHRDDCHKPLMQALQVE